MIPDENKLREVSHARHTSCDVSSTIAHLKVATAITGDPAAETAQNTNVAFLEHSDFSHSSFGSGPADFAPWPAEGNQDATPSP